MRHAMGAIPFLFAIGALPALAATLPGYCGGVGASSYTPRAVTIPPVILNRGTVITVTNATMLINGDTSSVKALVANPGPDGISLQEAVIATNNDPGTWVIQFAPAMKGSTIVVDSGPNIPGLSYLSGGNVTINGDIDGDGKPDITLTSLSGTNTGFFVLSGGNTLYGLALQGCGVCVEIQRPSAKFQLPPATGTTFSGITVGNLTMTDIQYAGISVAPVDGEIDATPPRSRGIPGTIFKSPATPSPAAPPVLPWASIWNSARPVTRCSTPPSPTTILCFRCQAREASR